MHLSEVEIENPISNAMLLSVHSSSFFFLHLLGEILSVDLASSLSSLVCHLESAERGAESSIRTAEHIQ